MDYRKFSEEALKKYIELPDEANPLYKRMHIELEQDSYKSIEANNGGSIEEIERIAEKSGMKFDAIIANNSYSINSKHENISISHDTSGYQNKSIDDKYEALAYATAKQVVRIEAKEDQEVSVAIAIGDLKSMSTIIETEAKEGGSIKLLELLLPGKGRQIRSYLNLMHVKKNASVYFTLLNENDLEADNAINTYAWIEEKAALESCFVYLGGKKTRARNYVYGKRNARILTSEIAFASGSQKMDISSVAYLNENRGSARILNRTVATDNAEAMVKNFSYVIDTANSSESEIEERGLVKDSAEIYFLPGMRIDCGSVTAKHSSYTGPLDEEAIFYLLSKGLSKKEAEYMLLKGFLALPISIIKEDRAKELASTGICNKLLGKAGIQQIDANLIAWQDKSKKVLM